MVSAEDIVWFRESFGDRIMGELSGTPFDIDMLTALACQETGELWSKMRGKGLSPDEIAALCCGDTLDADKGRRAFPRTKKELVYVTGGEKMFKIARDALLAMAEHVPDYAFANSRANKFCHGFGVFQYDLQFFLSDPAYFLERRYENFENSLARAMIELRRGLRTLGWQSRAEISDLEFCHVAICYNRGSFDPARGLKQGHEDEGKYYGEFIRDYLAMARHSYASSPVAGMAPLPLAAAGFAAGPSFRVDIATRPLRLRSAPRISTPADANVVATLADGAIVRSVSGSPVNNFIEVEAILGGQLFRGFASADFLVRITAPQAAAERDALALPATIGAVPEAHLKPAAGVVTKRSGIATARSLDEANMPGRTAADPAGLRAELAQIIDYLGTDKPAHKRYQPRDGLTFCNIYAHDYCSLAGVYLPRVWWTGPALVKLAAGESVAPLLDATVYEQRANDIFRWLGDFGEAFGWRRATTLDELQNHANLGGVAVIVARRRNEGRSGHIVAVVPETATETAKRDAHGRIELALQSQAGTVNFRYGLSAADWWKNERFAEAAFWLHA
ncbi:hypothetical protein [Sphingopyxis fribergensis]